MFVVGLVFTLLGTIWSVTQELERIEQENNNNLEKQPLPEDK